MRATVTIDYGCGVTDRYEIDEPPDVLSTIIENAENVTHIAGLSIVRMTVTPVFTVTDGVVLLGALLYALVFGALCFLLWLTTNGG